MDEHAGWVQTQGANTQVLVQKFFLAKKINKSIENFVKMKNKHKETLKIA